MQAPAEPLVAPGVDATRWLAVGSVLGLIVLGLVWELGFMKSLWAVKVLPLTLPLAGLLRRRLYTYRWVSLLVWLYLAEGAVRITDKPPTPPFAAAEIVLAVVLFTACVLHVRIRLKNKTHDEQAAG